MMDITKSREEFEIEFAAKRGLRIEQVISARHGDGYWDEARIVTAGIGLAWHFWKASRESIEVEYPDFDPYGYPSRLNYDIKQALKNAGIRIKGGGK
ncbi:hypothetical protein [Yersinia kristensenii]|uniref:hypothetical protein n=1 Tax=Yersinia kristensenii TaxID=28152 RepID=UPI0005E1C7B0|nr:hypothetical protein [Yersinia kristensenii]CFR20077.1 Uncharacterised protein [Yersinia kristensenii]